MFGEADAINFLDKKLKNSGLEGLTEINPKGSHAKLAARLFLSVRAVDPYSQEAVCSQSHQYHVFIQM